MESHKRKKYRCQLCHELEGGEVACDLESYDTPDSCPIGGDEANWVEQKVGE